MKNSVLLGFRHAMVGVPRALWQSQVRQEAQKARASLGFMSDEHRTVHHLLVRELPRVGEPISAAYIAQKLHLSMDRVSAILNDLEQHMTFLFRNEAGAVAWAYPVTTDPTPHRVTFSSGEQIYAAGAIDAIATPFVQGQLWFDSLSFTIKTQCAHCARPIQIEIDGQLNYHVQQGDADPLIYVPLVDFAKLGDPSIIDAFGRKSVFFWSEEHARQYRRQMADTRGIYVTLDQAVYITPPTQGALFGFPELDGMARCG